MNAIQHIAFQKMQPDQKYLYDSPTEPYFDRSWVLPDIKKAGW